MILMKCKGYGKIKNGESTTHQYGTKRTITISYSMRNTVQDAAGNKTNDNTTSFFYPILIYRIFYKNEIPNTNTVMPILLKRFSPINFSRSVSDFEEEAKKGLVGSFFSTTISSRLISITGCGPCFFISGVKIGFISSFGVTTIGGGTNVFCTGFSSTVMFFVSTGSFKVLTSLVSAAISSLKYLIRSYNDSVSFCCSDVRFKIITRIIKAISGMRISRMINPVIRGGLVNNSC